MKRFFAALVLFASISAFSMTLVAQSLPAPHSESPAHVLSLSDDFGRWRRVHIVDREPLVIKEGLLAPSVSDRIAFTTFLREDNTGLIRLLPREVYDSASYRKVKELKIQGGGAYYSFANLTHAYGRGSDIELHNNKLSVGFAGADYGMLTNIGDTPLEQIRWDIIRERDIAAYRPPRSLPAAKEEQRRFSSGDGMRFDGLHYQRTLPVQENSTYLLRSIAYGTSDVLVAFRLARKDTDGSVIIAWKLLKRYPTPDFKVDMPQARLPPSRSTIRVGRR